MPETEDEFFKSWHGACQRLLGQIECFATNIEHTDSQTEPLIIKEFLRMAGEIAKRKIMALPRPAFDPDRYGDFEFYHAVTQAAIAHPTIWDLLNFDVVSQKITAAPGWKDFNEDHSAQLEFERFASNETPKKMSTHMLTGYIEHVVIKHFIKEMVGASSEKHHTFDDECKLEETDEANNAFRLAVQKTIAAASELKLKLSFAD